MTNIERKQPSNVFADCVPVPSAQEAKVAELMGNFNDLGMQFAAIMQERLMPADQIRVGKDNIEESETAYSRWGERIPMWIILRKKDLSGRSMFAGTIGVGHCSYSLGSGTPNNFRTKYHDFDTEEALERARIELRNVESVRASEKAVAVDCFGMFRLLDRSANYHKWNTGTKTLSRYMPLSMFSFVLSDNPLKADNLFDMQKSRTAKSLSRALEQRMKQTIQDYAHDLEEERAELEPGQALERPAAYYLPKSGLLDLHDKPQQDNPKKRGGFRRLLGR